MNPRLRQFIEIFDKGGCDKTNSDNNYYQHLLYSEGCSNIIIGNFFFLNEGSGEPDI